MTFNILSLAAVGSEIIMLSGACIILLINAFKLKSENNTLTYSLSLIVLLLGSVMTFINFGENIGPAWNGHFFKDTMGDLLKIFIYISVLLSFIFSRGYVKDRNLFNGEFFVLGLFAVLGMSVMISSGSFITIFMGLELLSLPLYTMVALDHASVVANESAMGYFVRGSISSVILLYGMSLLYGVTGSLNLVEVSHAIQQLVTEASTRDQIILIFGTVFVVGGVSFKFGSLPFYMWFSNVYQHVHPLATLFLSTIPKLVAFAMMVRLLAGTLDPLFGQWQQMLAIMALLSMAAADHIMGSSRIPFVKKEFIENSTLQSH